MINTARDKMQIVISQRDCSYFCAFLDCSPMPFALFATYKNARMPAVEAEHKLSVDQLSPAFMSLK